MSRSEKLKQTLQSLDEEKSGFILTSQVRAVLSHVMEDKDVESLLQTAVREVGVNGKINYNQFVDYLCLDNQEASSPVSTTASVDETQEKMQKRLEEAESEVHALRLMLRRQPLEFTVGQYNILAGYLGANKEPWFLYGVDMPESRRAEIVKLHQQRGPDGKPVNAGWPNYVRGVLSEEEIKKVEAIDAQDFNWEARKDRLVDVIRDMDSDLLSLVECDHYEDHFKPALEKMGYDSVWRKRPRPSSADGCCIAWKKGFFEIMATHCVEYVDKYDPVAKRTFKDRIALVALLRSVAGGRTLCFVSTHLQRNPEDPTQDMLRARQVGQVLREIGELTKKHNAHGAPVVLTGDLNCTSFGRLRGIANTVSLLNRDVYMHPFTFDCADVPTGVTSVTTARCMRIDAIMFQSQRLELVDVMELPELDPESPIPNTQHPSDHVPIVAQFRFRSSLHTTQQVAREWYLCLGGGCSSTPLNERQLKSAYKLYDLDGEGMVTFQTAKRVLTTLFGTLPPHYEDILPRSCNSESSGGMSFKQFVSAYVQAVKQGGMPGIQDLTDAFEAFDTDGNGSLQLEELLSAFKTCAPVELPPEDLIALFKAIDASGDGSIDLEEMIDYLSKVWADAFSLPENMKRRSMLSLDPMPPRG